MDEGVLKVPPALLWLTLQCSNSSSELSFLGFVAHAILFRGTGKYVQLCTHQADNWAVFLLPRQKIALILLLTEVCMAERQDERAGPRGGESLGEIRT